MRSTSANTIALIALLASPALATPLPVAAPRDTNTFPGGSIGTITGAPSGPLGDLLNKVDSLFKRDGANFEDAKRDLASIIQNASTLPVDDKQTVKTALVNKISALQGSDVAARGFAGSVGGAVAGGAASAVVGNLLSQIESLFRRDDELVARGLATTAIGGVTSIATNTAVSDLLNKIESVFRRDEFDAYAKRDLADIIKNASSLAPSDKQTVKTALVNKISGLKGSDVASRGVASTVGGAVAGGAASAVVGNLLNQIESLFRREAELEALQRRAISVKPSSSGGSSGSGIGAAVAGGAASGAVGNLLNKIESLFRRDDELGLGVERIPTTPTSGDDYEATKRDLLTDSDVTSRGVAGTVGGAVAGGAASAVVGNLLNQIESLFRREAELEVLQRRAISVKPSSSSGSSGSGIGAAVAGGAASGAVGNLLNKIESLFRRHEIEMERRALSVKPSSSGSSSGRGIGGAVAGGAASAVVGNLLNQIESLFRRDDPEATKRDLADIIKDASSLSPPDKQTVKTALMNKVSTLKDSDVAARGVASTVGGAVAGGAASAVVGNLLSQIESLFRREAQLEGLQSRALSVKPSSTSGSGIGGAVAGGAASAVVGNLLNQVESLFRRDEHEATKRDLADIIKGASSLSPPDKENVKTALMNKISTLQNSDVAARGVFGNGIGGAVAGGVASGIAGNLLHQLEGLVSRDDSLLARTESWAINELD